MVYNIFMIDFKQAIFDRENAFLSRYACKSADTKGRSRPIEPCPMRTEFVRDRDRIIHCKAFRRLKHKTQVFISPEGDHYRTRLTHTLEVAQIARSAARALRLNEDLTEAIALGHDLGHTPFGHAGEMVLNGLIEGGFKHNEQSLRVVDLLENDGEGLNLTHEVRDPILNHKNSGKPCTLEGMVVQFADRCAYINHDIEDAITAGVLSPDDLPDKCVKVLGDTKSKRINSMIVDLVTTSYDQPWVKQSDEFRTATTDLREFLFDAVYFNPIAKGEEKKTKRMIELLFRYYMQHSDELPEFHKSMLSTTPLDRVVGDYIASFTDRYAVRKIEEIYVPKGFL